MLLVALACSAEGYDPPSGDDDSGNAGTESSQGGHATSPTGGAGGKSGAAGSASGSSGTSGGRGGSGGSNSSSGGSNSSSGGSNSSSGGSNSSNGGSNGGGAGGTLLGGSGDQGTGGDRSGGMSFGGRASGGTESGAGGLNAQGGSFGGGMAGKGGSGGGTGGDTSTPGLGEWTRGYVATMYGDINSGDCTAYSGNFTDHTPISTYTCVLGNGPRKVSLSSYSAGQANNASYYAALGDLSSLWSANGSASPCTCNGSTTATCGGPQCAAEISSTGSCGLCVAVKCDPESAFEDDSGFSHNSSCNATTYVVVQNIDACPHNHTTNVSSSSGWCTDRQSEHIDLSCSGLGDISNLGTRVGQAGWLPVSVQVVDCAVGLGKHSL